MTVDGHHTGTGGRADALELHRPRTIDASEPERTTGPDARGARYSIRTFT